ncbi:MAG: hypothetical protein LIP77_11220, partial [Planctomycetes bacterium]|nr:hypothetical protein [Planctomycetota bacterium]
MHTRLLTLALAVLLGWTACGLAVSVSDNDIPVKILPAGCDNDDCGGTGGEDTASPATSRPGPNPPTNPACTASPYQINPVDAPDSLPSRGEPVALEAVFGGTGALYRWGRHIGFGPLSRLNILHKALLTRDRQYVRVCDPADNSTTTFLRRGSGDEYSLVYGVSADDTVVTLEDEENGLPQRMVLRFPCGAWIALEYESDITRNEMDGHVYRAVERGSRTGHVTTIRYGEDSIVVTDASGHDYVCHFDDQDRIDEISITVDGETRRWTYAYQTNDSIVTETNEQTGRKITTDIHGRLVVYSITEAGADGTSQESTFLRTSWNSNGFPQTIIRAPQPSVSAGGNPSVKYTNTTPGAKASYLFASEGLLEKRDAFDNVITFKRNRQRLATETVDEAGQLWITRYDGNGNLLHRVDPDGAEIIQEFDERCNRILRRVRLTDDDWAEYRYRYDERNQLIAILLPDGGETRYIRDGDGDVRYTLKKMADNQWSATAYTFNGNGQVVTFTQPYFVVNPDAPEVGKPAAVTRIDYDPWGNQIRRTDELGNEFAYEYDGENRLTAEPDPLGPRTDNAYDGLGRLPRVRDAAANLM